MVSRAAFQAWRFKTDVPASIYPRTPQGATKILMPALRRCKRKVENPNANKGRGGFNGDMVNDATRLWLASLLEMMVRAPPP
jgi:hypothetical protein